MTEKSLVCGIENGLCILYDVATCEYRDHMQLQTFNCALTQIENCPGLTTQKESASIYACSGNGRTVEFFSLDNNQQIKPVEHLGLSRINHGEKVNCLRYSDRKIFVTDTTDNLTIYDFNE